MAFLKVNTERMNNKGSVFVALVDDRKVVIGRCKNGDKVAAIMSIIPNLAIDGRVPSVEITKMKKVSNMYIAEATMNSFLMDFVDDSGDFYEVSNEILDECWKEL